MRNIDSLKKDFKNLVKRNSILSSKRDILRECNKKIGDYNKKVEDIFKSKVKELEMWTGMNIEVNKNTGEDNNIDNTLQSIKSQLNDIDNELKSKIN